MGFHHHQGGFVFLPVRVVAVFAFQLFHKLFNSPEETTRTQENAFFRLECEQIVGPRTNGADLEKWPVACQFSTFAKVRAAKVRAAKVRAAKVRAAKVRAAKVRAVKVRAAKVRAAKVRAVKVRAVKVRAAQVRAAKVRAAQVRAAKVRAVKVRAAKVRAAKVRFRVYRGLNSNRNTVVFAFVAEQHFKRKAGFNFNFHGVYLSRWLKVIQV